MRRLRVGKSIHFGRYSRAKTRPRPAFAPHRNQYGGWGLSISDTQDIDGGGLISAASLLFAPGERPDASAIARLAETTSAFSISLDPAEGAGDGGNWLELLDHGLTFDLRGLAPGPAAAAPPRSHEFGLPDDFDAVRMQAVTLQPGPHLAEGSAMLPVVRSLAGLTAALAALPGVRAVAWHAARSWCSTGHFRDSVHRWLEGGPFPGLGLTALVSMPDGGMQSQGLALFTGQELRLEPELAKDRAAAAKTGLRLLHWLVEHGSVTGPESLPGPDGVPLRLEPSENTRFVRVWRG